MAATLVGRYYGEICHARASQNGLRRHERLPTVLETGSRRGGRSRSGLSSVASTTVWGGVTFGFECSWGGDAKGRNGRRAWAGRCSASRWMPPEDDVKDVDDTPIDLDAEDAVPGIEMPSGACV